MLMLILLIVILNPLNIRLNYQEIQSQMERKGNLKNVTSTVLLKHFWRSLEMSLIAKLN